MTVEDLSDMVRSPHLRYVFAGYVAVRLREIEREVQDMLSSAECDREHVGLFVLDKAWANTHDAVVFGMQEQVAMAMVRLHRVVAYCMGPLPHSVDRFENVRLMRDAISQYVSEVEELLEGV